MTNQGSHIILRKLYLVYFGLGIRMPNHSNFLHCYPIEIATNKPKLLGLFFAATFIIFVPLIIISYTHPYLIYFISMHMAKITIFIFLIVASLLAHYRIGSKKFYTPLLDFHLFLLLNYCFFSRSFLVFVHKCIMELCGIATYTIITHVNTIRFGRVEGGKVTA
jgi:hypothetical protein